jgi:Zn-dependent peptidase ImmA (M78 family)/transcriptional regulator with XRE-family HTH domain
MQALIENIKNSGFTLEMIEKKTGIRQERLNSIISGLVEPDMGEVRKISKLLKVSTDFLVSNDKYQEINVLFRQAISNERQKQKADIISYMVGNAFTLIGNNPAHNNFFQNFPVLENSFKNARFLAGVFRKSYYKGDFLNPILDLPRLVTEELDCILFVTDLGNDTDGASAIINGVPFIFISPRFEPRMLFTLAHELAHIISHHGSGNFAKIDQHISELGRNKFKDEAFANAFASELLMPEEAVGSALQSLRRRFQNTGPIGDIEIIYLSRFYGVSFEVAAKRCEDVNLLPYGGAFSLSEQIKNDYGSAEKRADELGVPERPKIVFPKVSASLIQSAIDKIESGEISIGKASEILSIPIADLLKKNVSNK